MFPESEKASAETFFGGPVSILIELNPKVKILPCPRG
jgi:hypothetical protein